MQDFIKKNQPYKMLDNTKWTEIYNKHSKKMVWVCKRYVNDLSLAEDLMHEGFITAMQKQNTFSGFGSFEGWLRTIMVNTSLMYLRKNKSNLFVSDVEISDNATVIPDMNSTYDIKNKIINTDFSQQELLDVIETIPEHHKIVFNMYVIDKFSHNEISKTLNINTNTSKSHLLRARKKIQELLLLKADEKEQKKDRRKLFFWFLFTSTYVDRIYSKGLSSIQEKPSKPFNIDEVIKQQNLPDKITSGYIFGITLQNFAILIISIVSVLTLFFCFFDMDKSVNKKEDDVNEVTNSNRKTLNNQTLIVASERDSSQVNETKDSASVKKENLTVLTNIKDSLNSSKKAVVTAPKSNIKVNKKRKNKSPVVVKKIIDTIYVYK